MTFDVRKMTTEDVPACVVILNHIIALGGSTAYEDPYTETHFADHYLRFRTHNQKITVAARAIAERKTVGDLS